MPTTQTTAETKMPPKVPKIAILMAAYNGMQWITEQLESIQVQRNIAIHIFISIDLSTDGTEAWCEQYASQHTNVTLLPACPRFGGAARNFFRLFRDVDLESFDLVALSDQDDVWHEDKLCRASRSLADNGADAYSSSVTAFWPDGKTRLLDKAQPQVKWDHYFEAAGPGCTYAFSNRFALYLQQQIRSNWHRLQQVTLHDWYIYAMARTHGYSWYIDPIPGMNYRQHPSNQVGANVGSAALLARYRSIRSGWWFGQVRLIEELANAGTPADSWPPWLELKRSDLLQLCLQAANCRRKRREQWLFGLLCLTTAIFGSSKK